MPQSAFKLQREVDRIVRANGDVFSAVAGITNDAGDYYWSGAAGLAHSYRGDPMKVDTPIFIASVTKIYTAVVVMMLEEKQALSLRDPVVQYLPHDLMRGLHVHEGRDYTEQITIFNLLSHSSGLPDYFLDKSSGTQSLFDLIVRGVDQEFGVTDVTRTVRERLAPKFLPGDEKSGGRAYYSDTNYQLLGAVIEAVTAKPLQNVYSEFVFQPLGIVDTYLYGSGALNESRKGPPATLYHKDQPLQMDRTMRSFGPDGGLVSTVQDSLKFLRSLMQGQLFKSPTTLDRMKRWRKLFFPIQYGLGLMRFRLPRVLSPFGPAPELIGHSGASSSFLYHHEGTGLYLAGTLNQIDKRGRPFRLMLKLIREHLKE